MTIAEFQARVSNPCLRSTATVPAESEDVRALEPLESNTEGPLVKHHGSCHCGRTRVELLVDIAGLEVKEGAVRA